MIGTFALLGLIGISTLKTYTDNHTTEIEKQKQQYSDLVNNNPYKKYNKSSKTERYLRGLPPNKYLNQLASLSLNPNTGIPAPEDLEKLRNELLHRPQTKSTPGRFSNTWKERGPNNVGGITRALFFDPLDDRRIFAGGVSGGLWLNTNIEDPNSSWQQITGIANHVNVSAITGDPNDPNVMYLSTGQSSTEGQVLGNGIYMSKDRGMHWIPIEITPAFNQQFEPFNKFFSNQIVFISDIITRDNNGVTELYAGVNEDLFVYTFRGSTANNLNTTNAGLYKVIDPANQQEPTLTRVEVPELIATKQKESFFNNDEPVTFYSPIDDLELDVAGNLWLTTGHIDTFKVSGGDIIKSTDGVNFTKEYKIQNAYRTELEPSTQNSNKFYVAYWERSSSLNIDEAQLLRTTDAFATVEKIAEPNDIEGNIPAHDFTAGQAFHNLLIESHPDNDNILYVGGINLFVSNDSGNTWTQLTVDPNGKAQNLLNAPVIHADQQTLVFNPSNHNQAILGNDGGVYYIHSLNAGGALQSIEARNKDYNVTQFVTTAVGPTAPGSDTLFFIAGAQDNGTQIFDQPIAGINSSLEIVPGDGFNNFIDKDGTYMIAALPKNRIAKFKLPWTGATFFDDEVIELINTDSGDFVNQMGYDHDTDILLSNGSRSNETNGKILTIDIANEQVDSISHPRLLLFDKPTAFRASPYTDNTWLIGTSDSKLLKLSNVALGTADWERIKTPFKLRGSISSVRYGKSEQEIFVTLYNFGAFNIWHSTDGGTTWNNKDNSDNSFFPLPDMPVYDILQNPLNPKEVMIATAFGVWTTTDITQEYPDWFPSINGMKNVSVTSFDYWEKDGDPTDHIVIASTYGRGVFTGKFTTEDGNDTEAPTASLSVANVTDTSADISWDDVKDNSKIIQYSLFSDDRSIDFFSENTIITSHSPDNLTPDTAYTIRLRIIDFSFNFGKSDPLTFITKSDVDFCTAHGKNTSQEFIGRITLEAVDNISDQGINGYSDFTGGTLFASLTKDTNHKIVIQPTWLQGAKEEGYAAWIDYNRDGVFDATEKVLEIDPTNLTPATATFEVPADAIEGVTRMRIAMKRGGIATPCETFSHGEVEDYSVIIKSDESITRDITTKNLEDKMVVFPNPVVNGKVQVSLPKSSAKTAAKNGLINSIAPYTLYSLTGSIVQKGMLSRTPIDISELRNGTYFIKVFTDHKQYTQQIIKN